MRNILLILVALIFPVHIMAIRPFVRNYTRDNYQSGTQNWKITQSESEIMYFANNNGLLEFDGENWRTFPIENFTNVRSALVATDKKIYAGAFNEFGYYEENRNGKLSYHSLRKLVDGIHDLHEIWEIHEADNNVIYFQSDSYVIKYFDEKIKTFHFDSRIDISNYVHNILFVASVSKGVQILNGDLFIQMPGSELLQNKRVSAILPYGEKSVLFATSFHGVFIYDGLSIKPFVTEIDNFLKENQVFCAATNGSQIVYGTVQKGVVIQNLEKNEIMYINTYSGLQNNTVLSVFFDKNQNLWLGLDKGIDYVLLDTPILEIFDSNNLYGAGYASKIMNNAIYFGTNQGLYRTSFPLKSSPEPFQLQLVNGLEGQIWKLKEIDNTLFCGADRGAFIVSPMGIKKLENSGTWNFQQLKSKPNFILACSYKGLYVLKKNKGNWEFSHYIKGDFIESSGNFEETEDGKIWFSHWQKGVYLLSFNGEMDSITKIQIFDTSKGFPINQNNIVFRINNKMVFSSVYGFFKYDAHGDKVIADDKWNALFKSPPNSIRLHEGGNNSIWCISGSFFGLITKKNDKLELDSLTYRSLQPKMIIGFEDFNFITENDVIVSNEDGFSLVHLGKAGRRDRQLKAIIKQVVITSTSDSVIAGRISVNNNKTDSIEHKHNSLRFEFASPEYGNPQLIMYGYKLEGYDKEWSSFSSTTIKEYTKLPKGNYTFKLKATSLASQTSEETSYTFVVLPAWYESIFALIIYFILFLIATYYLLKYIEKRSKHGAVEMEKKKEKEMKEQERKFEEESLSKKKEISELKNQRLHNELRHKAQELANTTMNIIRKNEILMNLTNEIEKLYEVSDKKDSEGVKKKLTFMQRMIKDNIKHDDDLKKFQENFDIVYEDYLKRLEEKYPNLNVTDRKICAYLKMNLSSKDMAPLLNMTVRSVEMNRYRIRKKMNLEREVNLTDFLQKF